MRLAAAITGSLREFMAAEIAAGERATSAAMLTATRGATLDLRQMTIRAGLARRLATTWRSEVYPKGTVSLSAAGFVYSAAPKIAESMAYGAIIRARGGRFLAIPTDAAPAKGADGKRLSPKNFPSGRYGPLRFVPRRRGHALLVVDNVRLSQRGKATRRAANPFTKRGAYRKGITTVVMFTLVPQVRMKKRVDLPAVERKWAGALPGLILAAWDLEAANNAPPVYTGPRSTGPSMGLFY